MVVEPDDADDEERHQVGQVARPLVPECAAQVAFRVDGDLDVQDQQRDDDASTPSLKASSRPTLIPNPPPSS